MSLLHHHPRCPQCELRFANRAEMRWHLCEDHPVPSTTTSSPIVLLVERMEPALPPEPRRRWAWLGFGRRRG